jgi:chromosome segregation ATPase
MKHKLPRPIAWMKSHERTITIFGALILAGTFLIKDIIGEDMKDLKDSISQSESIFRTKMEFLAVRNKLDFIQKDVSKVRDEIDSTKIKSSQQKPTRSAEESFWNSSEFQYIQMRLPIDKEVENIEELAEFVPMAKEDRKTVADDKKALETLEAEAQKLDQKKHAPQDLEDSMMSIELRASEVEIQLRYISESLLSLAKKTEHEKEAYYKACKWGTVMCFVIGLAIALVGKIYDFEVFEP